MFVTKSIVAGLTYSFDLFYFVFVDLLIFTMITCDTLPAWCRCFTKFRMFKISDISTNCSPTNEVTFFPTSEENPLRGLLRIWGITSWVANS